VTKKDDRIERAVAELEDGGRVLITRLQYLGDVVLTLPMVDAVRRRFPRSQVDYLCRPPAADLLQGDPRFTAVFELRPQDGIGVSLDLIRRLRARKYTATVDLYTNPRSAWLTRLSGAPLRIGGDRRGRRRLYTHPVTVPAEVRSALAHHMRFVEPLGVTAPPSKPVVEPTEYEIKAARDLLESVGVDTRRPQRPRIGIHPGGKWEVKRWPARSFVELTNRLMDEWDASVVVFTGPGEDIHTDRLRASVGEGAAFLPELPVRSVAAVLSVLDGMVVSDGGVMHLAVAVGTPTVGIFGSAEPEVWFPYESFGPYAAATVPVDCRPCHQHTCPLGHTDCLNRLTPAMILDTLRGVLAGTNGTRGTTVTAGDDG